MPTNKDESTELIKYLGYEIDKINSNSKVEIDTIYMRITWLAENNFGYFIVELRDNNEVWIGNEASKDLEEIHGLSGIFPVFNVADSKFPSDLFDYIKKELK